MYFSLAAEGDVLYNAERFLQEEANRKRLDEEMEELKKDSEVWDKIFAITEDEPIAEKAEELEEQI
jgi:hypothetical protein